MDLPFKVRFLEWGGLEQTLKAIQFQPTTSFLLSIGRDYDKVFPGHSDLHSQQPQLSQPNVIAEAL